MPRSRPTQASPHFLSRGHSLSNATRAEIIDLLGYGKLDLMQDTVNRQLPGTKVLKREPGGPIELIDAPTTQDAAHEPDVGKIILAVEFTLGIYIDGEHHLDHIPRSSHYVAAFKPAEKEALKLLKRLEGWTDYFREQFVLRGANIHSIERALASLVKVSAAVIKDCEKASSKGAPRNTALRK